MENKNRREIDTLLKEAENIGAFLKQQIANQKIKELIYIQNIQKFLNAIEDYKKTMSDEK